MNQFDQLVAHLKNLQSKKIQQVTLDVKWLMGVLNVMPVDIENTVQPQKDNKSYMIDGGTFLND